MATDDNGNSERGVTHHQVAVLTFTLDLATFQVAIGGQPLPLSLAMMIAGEGMRILEELRRMAAAMQLQQQLRQAAADQALADSLRKGR